MYSSKLLHISATPDKTYVVACLKHTKVLTMELIIFVSYTFCIQSFLIIGRNGWLFNRSTHTGRVGHAADSGQSYRVHNKASAKCRTGHSDEELLLINITSAMFAMMCGVSITCNFCRFYTLLFSDPRLIQSMSMRNSIIIIPWFLGLTLAPVHQKIDKP